MRYSPSTNINLTIEDDDLFIEARLLVSFSEGTPRWRGSIYTCPSDVDWYGEDPSVSGVEEIEATNVCWTDEDGDQFGLGSYEPAYVERAVERFIEEWVWDHTDEVNDLLNEQLQAEAEAAAEAAAEDAYENGRMPRRYY